MNFLSLIEAKRDGKALNEVQIREVVAGYVGDKIKHYQMAALLMAIHFRGLNTDETRALMLAMRDSGETLTFPERHRRIVDKHSTGGIGDKVSLPLAPLLVCLGFWVPMISGRGLGITGGTLDKLDSIPGFKTTLATEQILYQMERVGCVICGQTEKMVPADKKIYALRDVSGTVPSIPLIVASILSKKLAEDLDALILDVKFGSAAFMKTEAEARELAKMMVTLGNECDVNTRAILTDMNSPLGRSAGNWLEVKESVECLEGKKNTDLRTLVVECAAHLLVQTKKAKDVETARKMAEDCLDSGAPAKKFDEMLVAQGADLEAFNEKLHRPVTAPVSLELKSKTAGYVSKCDAAIIGEVVRELGGGRLTKESKINYDVGIDRLAKPGDKINKSQTLCRVHAMDSGQAKTALESLEYAFELTPEPPEKAPLITEVITG